MIHLGDHTTFLFLYALFHENHESSFFALARPEIFQKFALLIIWCYSAERNVHKCQLLLVANKFTRPLASLKGIMSEFLALFRKIYYGILMSDDSTRPLKTVRVLEYTPNRVLNFVNIVIFDGMKKACLFTSGLTNQRATYFKTLEICIRPCMVM